VIFGFFLSVGLFGLICDLGCFRYVCMISFVDFIWVLVYAHQMFDEMFFSIFSFPEAG
jgi:hypothetical protein